MNRYIWREGVKVHQWLDPYYNDIPREMAKCYWIDVPTVPCEHEWVYCFDGDIWPNGIPNSCKHCNERKDG